MTLLPPPSLSLRSAAGKADLLRFLKQGDAANLDAVAALFGLERKEVIQPKRKQESVAYQPPDPVVDPQPIPQPDPPPKPCLNHWLPVHYQAKTPPADGAKAPGWITNATAFEDTLESRQPPPPSPPLSPWPTLWPFLRKCLGGMRETRRVDVNRLVRLIARNRAIQNLPRLKRLSWATHCQVLVDLDERLSPFWGDFWRLLAGLEHLRGRDGMDVYLFRAGPDSPYRRMNGLRWLDDGYRPPPLGTPILVLSDLGFYAQRHQPRLAWLALGERLHQLGHRPTALLPCPPRLWHASLLDPWRAVCWDRVPLKRGRAWSHQEHADEDAGKSKDRGVTTLLQATAPAIRVEPGLLRALRLLLPVDQADVGSEAQVWHHADVASNPIAMLLKPEGDIIQNLREGFRAMPDTGLKREILQTIERFHSFLPDVIGKEEGLIRRDLMQEALTPEDLDLLGRYIQTREKLGKTDLFGEAVARWFTRWQSRLHDTMRALPPIATALHYEKVVTEGQTQVEVPPGVDGQDFAWMYEPVSAVSEWELLTDGKGMRLRPISPNDPFTRGNFARFQFQNQVVHFSSEAFTRMIKMNSSQETQLQEPETKQFTITSDYQEIRFELLERPDWAIYLKRNLRGVSAKVRDHESQERELHWLRPGPIRLKDSTSDSSGSIGILSSGCWLDEPVFDRIFPGSQTLPSIQCPEWAAEIGFDEFGIFADIGNVEDGLRMRLIFPKLSLAKKPLRTFEDSGSIFISPPFWITEKPCSKYFAESLSPSFSEIPLGAKLLRKKSTKGDTFSWPDVEDILSWLQTEAALNSFHLPNYLQWYNFSRAGIGSASYVQPNWFSNGQAVVWPDELSWTGLESQFAHQEPLGFEMRQTTSDENQERYPFYLVTEY